LSNEINDFIHQYFKLKVIYDKLHWQHVIYVMMMMMMMLMMMINPLLDP